MITIIPYEESYQASIDEMMAGIAKEYAEPISSPAKPNFKPRLPKPYWIALDGARVVGTAGVIPLSNANVVLKRMMVRASHRGTNNQVSARLLELATDWSLSNGLKTMYLGTMAQFVAAQKFYEKTGFHAITENDLPADFPYVPVDTMYYMKHIAKRDEK